MNRTGCAGPARSAWPIRAQASRSVVIGRMEAGTMKLAEALAERSDCQDRIEKINKWLIRSARVQEGEQPAEDRTDFWRRPIECSRDCWNS